MMEHVHPLKTLRLSFTALWQTLPWAKMRKLLRVFALLVLMVILFKASTPLPGDLASRAAAHARNDLFDYVGWEVDALAAKAFERMFGNHDYLDEDARSAYVVAYMADMSTLLHLERDITAIYSTPTIPDPDAASADLRTERDALRDDLADRQGMMESIIEGQVSTVLAEDGLAFMGQILPPVAIRFTPLPDVLIISPRDDIRVSASISLDALPADQRHLLENSVDADLDVASIVVDIGGMSLYPSMIGETDWLVWGIETAVHEWVHHYLLFYPLGWNYFSDITPETRIINETTADLLGKELGNRVVRRYYPAFAPPEPDPVPVEETPEPTPTPPSDPPPFDFAAVMHDTRTTVDALLAEGRIEEAETYMDAQRLIFHENGYPIRKINQAYFAFYGGYQGTAGFGAAGEDSIGPMVRAIYAESTSAEAFLATMRGITTRDSLTAAYENLVQ